MLREDPETPICAHPRAAPAPRAKPIFTRRGACSLFIFSEAGGGGTLNRSSDMSKLFRMMENIEQLRPCSSP